MRIVDVLEPMIASGRALGHGLLDEVGVGDGGLDRLGGGDARLDALDRVGREQLVGDERRGLVEQPLAVALRDLGRDVGDLHVVPREREHLCDAAAHVAGADDGDGLGGHDQPFGSSERR